MKKFLTLWSFLLFTLVLSAQNEYYLFIQSENDQPYYVQVAGKTLSSSAIGHLIITGLKDSTYILHLGFPKNQFPEQLFQVKINRNDAGYQLKNMGTEGWALVNIQTLQPIIPQRAEPKKQSITYGDTKKTDVFSTLMAGLVNDSAVLYTSIARADPVKESSKTSIPEAAVASQEIVNQEETNKKDSAIVQNGVTNNGVPLKSDTLTTEVAKTDTSGSVAEIVRQIDLPKKDTTISTDEIVSQEKVSRDSAVKKGETSIKDEALKDTVLRSYEANKPPSVPGDQKVMADSVEKSLSPTVDARFSEKPLIIWFSETKTANGTEFVYIDMTSPDEIDTIRILVLTEDEVPLNETRKEAKGDSTGGKKEGQKRGSGKIIGRIFNKKTTTESKGPEDKSPSEAKQSTIKVTTVETIKTTNSPAENSTNKTEATTGKIETKEGQKDAPEQKTNSGNFLGKIFGKKNASKSPIADTVSKATPPQNTSTEKVTTIEKPKPGNSTTERNKSDEGTAEVEKLKKDQDDAEKTGTERFFKKIFGKKKNEPRTDSAVKVEAKGNESYIKVTTIESNKSVDTTRSKDVEKKVVLTNSDCSDFATDDDIEKLKVKMLSKKNIDGQIVEAKKFFKTKCLTTKQIKSLSFLYKTDADKYKLFDASYPFVSDSNNFMDLVVLLNEVYYINRFIAMVRM